MSNKEIDYAIIGGGVAGAYCAWRLQQTHGKRKKIVLFEYSDRIGGRFLTIRFPGSNLKAELGGMRYMPLQKVPGTGETIGHELLTKLVEFFKLETEPFPMGYYKKKDDRSDKEWGENNIAYFRGQHFKIKDLKDHQKSTPFKVDWSERGKSPIELQEEVQKKLVPGADKLNDLHKWCEVKVFGDYLWNYGFWNLLYRVLSPEAYLLLKYGSGYDTNASNGNAVALLPISKDYLPTTEYRTLKNGMMSLPERLVQEFVSLEGVMDSKDRVQLNYRLESIGDKDENGYYGLGFPVTCTEEKRRELTIDTGACDNEWKAKNIILAIPTVALQKIKWKPLLQNKEVIKMIESVIPQEAIKLVLEYPYTWWKAVVMPDLNDSERQFGLFCGRSITDLPIRQTYYFSNPADIKKKNPFAINPDKPALLMASYSDIESVPFWRGLEVSSPPTPDVKTSFVLLRSSSKVGEAISLLQKLHLTHVIVHRGIKNEEDNYYLFSESEVRSALKGKSTNSVIEQVLELHKHKPTQRFDISAIESAKGVRSLVFSDNNLIGFIDQETVLYDGHPHGYRASKIMVEEAQRQVATMHSQRELPQPTAAAYYDWADAPFGAAWHCWKPGYRFDQTIDLIRRPVKTENVFICGEAYSAYQGWAEGALNTAEQLLIYDLDEADRLARLIPTSKGRRAIDQLPSSTLRVDSKGRTY